MIFLAPYHHGHSVMRVPLQLCTHKNRSQKEIYQYLWFRKRSSWFFSYSWR